MQNYSLLLAMPPLETTFYKLSIFEVTVEGEVKFLLEKELIWEEEGRFRRETGRAITTLHVWINPLQVCDKWYQSLDFESDIIKRGR